MRTGFVDRRSLPLIAVPLGCLLAVAAHAALPPQYYHEARKTAASHLQLRIDEVRLLKGLPYDNCEVGATVLRDFRGDIAPGTPLHFTLNCQAPGVRPMPGPNAWHDLSRLRKAKFAEGFFRGISPRTGPVYGELAIVEAERDSPWCEAESGRCDLPPPEPPLVLECGGERGSWSNPLILRIADHRIAYWNAAGAGDAAERAWSPQLFPAERTPDLLEITPQSYSHASRLFTEGGERLLATRTITIDRATLAFQDRLARIDGSEPQVLTGTCRPVEDPASANTIVQPVP